MKNTGQCKCIGFREGFTKGRVYKYAAGSSGRWPWIAVDSDEDTKYDALFRYPTPKNFSDHSTFDLHFEIIK